MAWIETIAPSAWTEELALLRTEVADPADDSVDNIMQIHSLNPRGMAAHNTLYGSAMAGTRSLRKVDREMIAFVVSQTNECHY